MTIHTIKAIDWSHGDEYREIIWDDETGAVSGDHSDVQYIKDDLAQPRPLVLWWDEGHWKLPDPDHDPEQFLRVVWYNLINQVIDIILPDTLEGIEPASTESPYHIAYERDPDSVF